MISRFASCFFFVCTGCALALPWNFEILPNESSDVTVLGQIISNYVNKFLDNELIFISFVHDSKRDLLHFHEEVVTNLFQNSNLTDFSFNIGNTLISRRDIRRKAFNIILIDNTNSLR